MTQGLQFSSLFSGLDLPLAADNAGLVADSPSQTEGTQAAVFRQLLADEQQSTAVSKGQTIAASGVNLQQNTNESATDVADLSKSRTSEDASAETVKPLESESLDELPTATEALADQWLGLIRQSGDATLLLRQKAEFNTFIAADFGRGASTTETSDAAALLLLDTESAELLPTALENNTATYQKLETRLPLNQAVQDAGEIAALSRLAVASNLGSISQESTAQERLNLVKASEQASALMQAEQTTDALLQEQNRSEQSAKLGSGKVNPADLANLSAQNLQSELPAEASDLIEDKALTPSETAAKSATFASSQQDIQVSAKLNAVKASSDIVATTDVQLPDSSLLAKTVLTTESLELSDPSAELVNANKSSEFKLANLPEQANSELNRQIRMTQQTEQVMSVNPQQLAAVAESTPLVTNNAMPNNQSKTALSGSEFVLNDSDKLRMLTVGDDTMAQDSSSEQQSQQRQDSRQYHFHRLDVSLQQSNSATIQQSGLPNSMATRMAAQENTLEVTQALVRNEQFSSVIEQQHRPQSATVAPPSLAAQLKQLNLQQQDAAGQLRERVQLMVRQNIQVAEIRLDPAELGLMQIKINLQQEQASVQFIVQQQHAKELLEQQMPRLRELLQQQGMQLGEGQVQQQNRDDRQAAGQQSGNSKQQQGASADLDDNPQAISVQIKQSERLVDYYA
ncbi:flagellar hook-length control protein FliK [Alishewanella sp. d11]|uniref:flagellar hook-length control protein FliK n=1 Tax=Alishewanella sp. d11 TaxID=3414030 RepID=UPI003BF877DF